jgi:hypothetical protein
MALQTKSKTQSKSGSNSDFTAKQSFVGSGNSGTVWTRRQDLWQVKMTRSQNPVEDGCRHIFVV